MVSSPGERESVVGSSRKKIIGAFGVAALVAGTLVVAPGVAQAGVGTSPRVLINEVYGGGGNSGATYTRDFIELYNGSGAAVDLGGWSVQYASAAGSSWATTPLSGVIEPDGYLLVAQAAGAGGTVPIAPDVDGSIPMSGTAGKVALVTTAAALTCGTACSGSDAVVDFVGYGATANDSAGGVPTPAPSNVNSVSRNESHANTAVNGADFTAGAPTPTPANPTDIEDVGEKAIADIQGPGDASPFAGKIATVQGVVTAAYPTGGFNGFVIQTAGTGGAINLDTHSASDAIFVYSSGTNAVDAVAIGNEVRVKGLVSEFSGLTEITPAAAADVSVVGSGTVTAADVDWPTAPAQRESLESMLYQPFGDFTVTNTFATNRFGEVGLAVGDAPLRQPTDAFAPGTPEAAQVTADNAARAVVLDDGASLDFTAAANTGLTPPYVSLTEPVRVGEAVTFTDTVIVDFRNNTWKLNPTAQVAPGGPLAAPATFKNNRVDAPDAALLAKSGEPDITIASFNVLNYFTTLGADVPGCTSFKDRAGTPIAVDSCPGNGPRGAWDTASFERQQAKIVTAINGLDAAVVGLSEIENSAVLGEAPDEAVATLVDALNADAGAGTWAYIASPADLPPVSQMDVISNAIIYRPAQVAPTGEAHALGTESDVGEAFETAREPLAQVFTPAAGAPFLFVMNHFKSKGSVGNSPGDADSGDGQGAANGSRVRQATALRDWIPAVKGPATAVALVGDFNSYGMEDPLRLLYEAGYADAEQHFEVGKSSYSFSGLSGSLDHILINQDALDRATGADVWNINSGESIALQYSRYNYHGTLFYDESAFASSDHDPVVLGLRNGAAPTTTVQILGINDFHGRIVAGGGGPLEAGAAVLAGAVHQLRTQNPNTVFAAAGDLIGASTFDSFIAQDKPTIDALNAAGLEVSAVGNHEFDQGYDDLVNRVMAPESPTNQFGGANWAYLGANVRLVNGDPALPESWIREFGTVQVGFIGAVTDHLDELVSPEGIKDLTIEEPVVAANREAAKLKSQGADIIVLLVHEGAATPALESATDPASDFGKIVNGVDPDIDAIISGHTHLTYNHLIPVPEWADRPVTTRPVVSAGQYGYNLDQLLFTVDPASGDVVGVQSNTLPLVTTPPYPTDQPTATIVADAVANAEQLGRIELGQIDGPFNRAKVVGPPPAPPAPQVPTVAENRGGESTLGNLVAEVQQWATADPAFGGAQIAFMNPGGLRADMVGNAGTPAGYPAALTYRQAANVQPFANTLVNMRLTGAQIKTVLEQQWQPAGAARPFLRLGISEGFTYTYDPTAEAGAHITRMLLDGVPIDPATSYSVTVNSFLASGGDNFGELANGTNKRDTGQIDLQAMVDYLAEKTPVSVNFGQRSVGVDFPAGAPVGYRAGDTVAFALSSLIFPAVALGVGEKRDSTVSVSIDGGTSLGSFPIDTTVGTAITDEYGTAAVSVTLPAGLSAGTVNLTITGDVTGVLATIPLTVAATAVTSQTVLISTRTSYQQGAFLPAILIAGVGLSNGQLPRGKIAILRDGAEVARVSLTAGLGVYLAPRSLPRGTYVFQARFLPDDGAIVGSDSNPVTIRIR